MSDLMTAARYHGPGDVRLERVPVPEPAAGEVLIRVGTVGICGSDAVEYRHGPRMIRPGETVTLGHEFAGEVVAIGPGVPAGRVGELIACGAGISCGDCVMCRAGRTNLCLGYHTIGLHRAGGAAEYVTAPARICVPVGDRGLTADTAALGQPMAIATHARNRGGVRPGDTVLVVGAGGIGSFLTYACVMAGADVWAADLAPDRLALASALGSAHTIDAGRTPPADVLAGAGVRADVVFEVTGAPAGLDSALAAARPGVRIVLVGVQKNPYPATLGGWTLSEYDVRGTVAHVCAEDLPRALDLLAARGAGWADVAPVVLPLTDLVDGGLVPLADGRPAQTKTLFAPAASAPRPADHTRHRPSERNQA